MMVVLVTPENNKHMRYLSVIIISILVFVACKPVKKVQKIETAINKKDTTQKVILSKVPDVDSAAIVKDIMNKLVKRKIDFTTIIHYTVYHIHVEGYEHLYYRFLLQPMTRVIG